MIFVYNPGLFTVTETWLLEYFVSEWTSRTDPLQKIEMKRNDEMIKDFLCRAMTRFLKSICDYPQIM